MSLRHGTYEDAQALFSGTLFVAMALMLFNQAGLLIGSTAGMAFLLHYVTDISFGKLFFCGEPAVFTGSPGRAWAASSRSKPLFAWALLSLLTELFPHVMQVSYINPLFARCWAGLLLGTGCLFLARGTCSSLGAPPSCRCTCKPLRRAGGQGATGDRLRSCCWPCLWCRSRQVFYSVLAAVVMGVFYGSATGQAVWAVDRFLP